MMMMAMVVIMMMHRLGMVWSVCVCLVAASLSAGAHLWGMRRCKAHWIKPAITTHTHTHTHSRRALGHVSVCHLLWL